MNFAAADESKKLLEVLEPRTQLTNETIIAANATTDAAAEN